MNCVQALYASVFAAFSFYSSAKQNTMASGRKLKVLTLAEKGKLLDEVENGTKMCDAAEQFGIGKFSVSGTWKPIFHQGLLRQRTAIENVDCPL